MCTMDKYVFLQIGLEKIILHVLRITWSINRLGRNNFLQSNLKENIISVQLPLLLVYALHKRNDNFVVPIYAFINQQSLRFDFVTNSTVRDITSFNSKQFNINVFGCQNLTFDHVTIKTPGNSPNTDGIHIGRSTNINVINSKISSGDDCISIGDGSRDILIKGVICGPGHGISVGSLGKYHNEQPVLGVKVIGCTLTNTTTGVRIKTWPNSYPGIASDMHFENIIMNNVDNPILIDQGYCPWNQCKPQVRNSHHTDHIKNCWP
jgi:polygalacturonase